MCHRELPHQVYYPRDGDFGLINCIPKASGLVAVSKTRPIALHGVRKKWIMNVVSLQIEQIFPQLTYKPHMGCVKGRQMIHHIWGVKGGYDLLDTCFLVSFDFSIAFSTLSHSFVRSHPQTDPSRAAPSRAGCSDLGGCPHRAPTAHGARMDARVALVTELADNSAIRRALSWSVATAEASVTKLRRAAVPHGGGW